MDLHSAIHAPRPASDEMPVKSSTVAVVHTVKSEKLDIRAQSDVKKVDDDSGKDPDLQR